MVASFSPAWSGDADAHVTHALWDGDACEALGGAEAAGMAQALVAEGLVTIGEDGTVRGVPGRQWRHRTAADFEHEAAASEGRTAGGSKILR